MTTLHQIPVIPVHLQQAIAALEMMHPRTYRVEIIDNQVHWEHRLRGTTGILDLDYWTQEYNRRVITASGRHIEVNNA